MRAILWTEDDIPDEARSHKEFNRRRRIVTHYVVDAGSDGGDWAERCPYLQDWLDGPWRIVSASVTATEADGVVSEVTVVVLEDDGSEIP